MISTSWAYLLYQLLARASFHLFHYDLKGRWHASLGRPSLFPKGCQSLPVTISYLIIFHQLMVTEINNQNINIGIVIWYEQESNSKLAHMNLMSSQKNFFCISLNINQSLLKLLHVGIHYKAEKLMSIVFFYYYASKLLRRTQPSPYCTLYIS